MAKLKDPQKRFLIKSLACGKGVNWIIKEFKRLWSLDIFKSQVYYYDPARGSKLDVAWKALFNETREAYVREIDAIPMAHEGYRLRLLQEAWDDLFGGEGVLSIESLPAGLKILEQAAKERGGSYTNARRLADKDGEDLPLAGIMAPAGIFVIGASEINDMVQKKATPFEFGQEKGES